jgi:SAM-dependent methyltransferase
MDILTALNSNAEYSHRQLQMIVGAWVMSAALERKSKIAAGDGDVSENDYDKRSIYSLLYALYRTVGTVRDERGQPYEFAFNTWGYSWPRSFGPNPPHATAPQRFGRNAYSGLFAREAVREYVAQREGHVHVVEMGCGTGAGAAHVCQNVLPECTYEAIDMQASAIQTCRRKFVPDLKGRLRATCADVTQIDVGPASADLVAVCETHVTEQRGRVTDEDLRFFGQAHKLLKPGGFMVWGNAIPDATWEPSFSALDSIGLKLVEVNDVTEEAVAARDQDEARLNAYVEELLARFHAFRIPFLGPARRTLAEAALKNFSRHPGTRLYENMKSRHDTYKVALLQKTA